MVPVRVLLYLNEMGGAKCDTQVLEEILLVVYIGVKFLYSDTMYA